MEQEPLLVTILGLLAALTLFGATIAYFRRWNLDAAKDHRRTLAHIAHEIEKDKTAPKEVKEFIGGLANRAFDEALHKRLLKYAKGVAKLNDSNDGERVQNEMIAEYGVKYGPKLYTALNAFAIVVLYSDPFLGRRLRKRYRNHDGDLQRKARRSVLSSMSDRGNWWTDRSVPA